MDGWAASACGCCWVVRREAIRKVLIGDRQSSSVGAAVDGQLALLWPVPSSTMKHGLRWQTQQ